MSRVRLDSHTHLYDCHPLCEWVDTALSNLAPAPDIHAAVVIVDREGQNSLARMRKEVPSFGEWRDYPDRAGVQVSALAGCITYKGRNLSVISGVQYVTAERLEVLGLGVQRDVNDGVPCAEMVEMIRTSGGVVCLPWSPGKWLGVRGKAIARLLDRYKPGEIVFGDISMRSIVGPPSSVLASARHDQFMILPGSDPLPRYEDLKLVGSYGAEFVLPEGSSALDVPSAILALLRGKAQEMRVWGRPNSAVGAFLRFLTTL